MDAYTQYPFIAKDKTHLFNDGSVIQEEGHVKDLFHEDAQVTQSQTEPWWKIPLFVWEPVLFGTWDGVFTSCLINIFGVVLFLRTGWLVGNTGILLGMFLVSFVILVALVTVLSGIGVCERCSIGSGGVYSMISTALGGQVGGTVGLLYVFGQCVAGAMYATGFAESIADLLSFSNIWAVRGISLAVLLGLLGINLAGVKWIIRLQLLLLLLLAVSTLDFVVGSFSHLDREHGFVGYSEELLRNNTLPDYSEGENFFTVFGVFFPAATGVMAGFNMSGDLQRPASNIPTGSLTAIAISWFFYIVFVFLLGAICTRESLRYDFMIAEKVSLVGFLFLLGLYISSLASCMGGLYGAPRILQCIAQEKVIPVLAFLGHGRGPNKTPVAAIVLTSLLTMAFVFIGQVNVLAPIVTINFMLTYSAVDYSYFSLSMRYNLHRELQGRRRDSRTVGPSKPLISTKSQSYGSDGVVSKSYVGTLLEFTKDMDQLFKPFSKDTINDKTREERQKNEPTKVMQRKTRKPAKQTLQDSFLLGPEYNFSLPQESITVQEAINDPKSSTVQESTSVEKHSTIQINANEQGTSNVLETQPGFVTVPEIINDHECTAQERTNVQEHSTVQENTSVLMLETQTGYEQTQTFSEQNGQNDDEPHQAESAECNEGIIRNGRHVSADLGNSQKQKNEGDRFFCDNVCNSVDLCVGQHWCGSNSVSVHWASKSWIIPRSFSRFQLLKMDPVTSVKYSQEEASPPGTDICDSLVCRGWHGNHAAHGRECRFRLPRPLPPFIVYLYRGVCESVQLARKKGFRSIHFSSR
ncbi:solute carrier family 12 member 8 isoform X2 [Pleurodeles waltl]|uniref:solute carrier family 12 member 8 isoform X2 n=1 Tax=Pleurodeles waltl TaxID=8319 RepID=UPI0037096AFA